MKLPMPSLEQVGSAKKNGAGSTPPPTETGPPATPSKPEIQHSPTSGGERKRMPRRTPTAGLAAFFERLRDPPSWEVERTARKKAEAEAAAKADKKD